MESSQNTGNEPAIEVHGLGKSFTLFERPFQRLMQALRPGQALPEHRKWALQDVSFSVGKGEAFGILGRNGSGKSTLLKLISGVLQPTTGQIVTRGRILALLELGTGLNPELSGRANILNSAHLLGFPVDHIKRHMQDIEDFADIGEFFDRPVKIYSSGMLVRLSFAMYAFMEPDILIIDEALSVGDQFFARKCLAVIDRLRKQGTTMLFVSHDLGAIRSMCDRAMLLDGGHVGYIGDVDAALRAYLHPKKANAQAALTTTQETSEALTTRLHSLLEDDQPPQGEGWSVAGLQFADVAGNPCAIAEIGDQVVLQMALHGPSGMPDPAINVEITDRLGRVISGRQLPATPRLRLQRPTGQVTLVEVVIQLDITLGEYAARTTILGTGAAATSSILAIHYRGMIYPFHSPVGLPARFSVLGRQNRPAD